MSRECNFFLRDMAFAIEKILRYTQPLSYREFVDDEKTQDAVIRNLEIIGEAARHVPAAIRSKYKLVPWKSIIALRNIVTHEYFGVDLAIVWDIIRNKLPVLLSQVRDILKNER